MNKTAVLLVRSLEACGAAPDIVENSKRKGEQSQEQVLGWMKREMVAKANEIKRLTDNLETCQAAKRRAIVKLQRAREDCATFKAELQEEQSLRKAGPAPHRHAGDASTHPAPSQPQVAVNLTWGVVHTSSIAAGMCLYWALQHELPSMEYKFLLVCTFMAFFTWLFARLSAPRGFMALLLFGLAWAFMGWSASVKLRTMGH
eukprot:jgi/Astpho2/7151/Aster-01476